MSEDFWKRFNVIPITTTGSGAIDHFFASNSARVPSELVTALQGVPALVAGTRVAMAASLEATLAYSGGPASGSEGTVVLVRTASGDTTTAGNTVFVKWDSGGFFPVSIHHLVPAAKNRKTAANFVRVSAGMGDLDDFFRTSADSQDLVHKATQDLWSLKTTTKGEIYLARLFNEAGDPLKV